MRVVTLAATKGGVGKTTLASVLGVRAAKNGARVALIDTDPQCSLFRWWELRGQPTNPKLIEVDASIEALEMLMSEGWDWVFIDTPPGSIDRIEHAVFSSTFVLIPSKTSAIDVEAVDDVVDLCNEYGKPFAFVLNQVQAGWQKMADESAKYLSHYGPVLKTRIASRKPYVAAMTIGKSGPEMDRRGSTQEVDALWTELSRKISKASKVR